MPSNQAEGQATERYDYDVVVVGGGTTGVCAAFAAAWNGARTAIVEYYGFLGGMAAFKYSWLGFHDPLRRLIVKGIPLEIVNRVGELGGATEFYFDPIWNSAVGVNPTWLKVALGDMAKEEGIALFLHSLADGVEMSANRVEGVRIRNKQGCQTIRAKAVVDCTDSADIAVAAGAEAVFGRDGDNRPQVASLIVDIGGIDMEAVFDYFERRPDQMRPFPLGEAQVADLLRHMRTAPVFGMGAFPELVAQAVRDGVDFPRDRLVGIGMPACGEMKLVTTRVENVNPNDVRSYSDAEMEGLRQVKGLMEFVRKYMPGGKEARLVGSSHQIGLRETRHVVGEHWLTGEDLVRGRKFDDAVALGAYHLDVHSPDHKGLETKQPPVYHIPYRSLVPCGPENVLVAGRCLSADHLASASTRVIPIAAAQGQAAGTAAALAADSGRAPRSLGAEDLRAKLVQGGAELGQGLEGDAVQREGGTP